MNFLQLAQRLHRESARSGSGPTALSGASTEHRRLFDWIADAWLELQREPRDWRWMRATAQGDVGVGISTITGAALGATNFGSWRRPSRVYTVRAKTADQLASAPLSYLHPDRFSMAFLVGGIDNGAPQYWTISDDEELLIGPPPDQVYTITAQYHEAPIELGADADEPGMPSQFHMLLVWRALMELAAFDAAPEVYSRAKANYEAADSDLRASQAAPIEFVRSPLA